MSKVVFRNVTFADVVDFKHAKLYRVQFLECTFKGPVIFDHSYRGRGVKFIDVKFEVEMSLKSTNMKSILRNQILSPVSDLEVPSVLEPMYNVLMNSESSPEEDEVPTELFYDMDSEEYDEL